jgi:hypothetical protein
MSIDRAVAVALFILWLLTFSWYQFKSDVIESQWLSMFKQEIVGTIQQIARQQQTLDQRLQALEKK